MRKATARGLGAARPHFADGGDTGSDNSWGGGSNYGGWGGGVGGFGLGGVSSGQATGFGGASLSSGSSSSSWGGTGGASSGGSYGGTTSTHSTGSSANASNGWGGGSNYGGYSGSGGTGFGFGGGGLSSGSDGSSSYGGTSNDSSGSSSPYGGLGNISASSFGGTTGSNSGLGSIGSGSVGSFGSFGANAFGGVSGNAASGSGWNGSTSPVGLGLGYNGSTMMGRAMGDVSASAGYNGGVGSIAGGLSGSPAGYGVNGAFSAGSIGLPGQSTYNGYSGAHGGDAMAGFGNFGAVGLGDVAGFAGGMNPTDHFQMNALASAYDGAFPAMGYSPLAASVSGSLFSGVSGLGYGSNTTLNNVATGENFQAGFKGFGGLDRSAFGPVANGAEVGTAASPGVLAAAPVAESATFAAPVTPVQSMDLPFNANMPMGLRAFGQQFATPVGTAGQAPAAEAPSGFGTFGAGDVSAFGGLDRSVDFNAPTYRANVAMFSPFGQSTAGESIPGFGSADDVGTIGPAVARLGTATQPGFDNFGLSSAGTLTASLAGDDGKGLGAFTPPGWTAVGAKMDMVMNPSDYYADKYPGLTIHPTAAGVAALLGNASYESGGSRTRPGSIAVNPINSIGATGMFQHYRDRRDGMLRAAGINPNDDPRSIQQQLIGTFADQLGYGLNEIATDPSYAATRQALTAPGVSVADATSTVTHNFERPGLAAENSSRADRLASANAIMGFMADAHAYAVAHPGIYNLGGAPIGVAQKQAAVVPSTAHQDAIRAALAIAETGGYFDPAAVAAYRNGQFSDLSRMSIGAMSGEDSMDPAALAADRARWAQPSTAMADAAAMDARGAEGTPVSDQPPAAAPAAPLTVTPGEAAPDPAVKTTPSYLPGEKAAIKTGLNVALGAAMPIAGLINAGSGLLGGPTLGSLVTDYSSPGSVEQAGGQAGNGGWRDPVLYPTPAGSTGQSSGGSGAAVSTPTDTSGSSAGTAQKAYFAALKNLPGPAPAAQRSNAMALVPPDPSMTAGFYNPLLDPKVTAALR